MTKDKNRACKRWFRMNCAYRDRAKVLDLLRAEGFEPSMVHTPTGAMQVKEEFIPLGNSLANYFGFIYVQDISSMLPAIFLNPSKGSTVLDLCASPGSKTGQLSQLTDYEGLVVANEPNSSRLATLRSNLRRLNQMNVITTGYPGEDFPDQAGLFDYILLDVPCSGWGTLSKNPEAARMWTRERLTPLISLQKKLLAKAAELLTPGGKLVYSTCTTNEQENEEQILFAVDDLGLKGVDQDNDFIGDMICSDFQQTMPGAVRVNGSSIGGQNFFMSELTSQVSQEKLSFEKKNKRAAPLHVEYGQNMKDISWGKLWDFSGNVFFVPEKAWKYIEKGINAQGTHVGRQKKENLILNPRMRVFLPENKSEQSFTAQSHDQIENFIQGQSLSFDTKDKLVQFYWHDLGLGWLKSRNNRLFWSDR
ncbi:MAG: RsmB/NOP family class I SAM-dependent RNA methyltransferase [Desulfonatronovibrio sp.]